MAWTIDCTDTARTQMRKLDKPVVRRMFDFLDQQVAAPVDPRPSGKALNAALGGSWRYQVGECRAICDIQDGQLPVLDVQIGNQREIYR